MVLAREAILVGAVMLASCGRYGAVEMDAGDRDGRPCRYFGLPPGQHAEFQELPGATPWAGRVITYSFVPDGASIEAIRGLEPMGMEDNVLFKRMNECFHQDTQRWQGIIRTAFGKWSDATDLTFREVFDDGAKYPGEGGPKRGDIRLWCRSVDGKKGSVYATTVGPRDGDIRFDKLEDWDDSTLARVALHEIGHSLGLDHCCPCDGTKVMENQANSSLGVAEDDVRGIHHLYGDKFEPNDDRPVEVQPDVLKAARLSLSGTARRRDVDQFLIPFTVGKRLTVRATPTGTSYSIGAGECGGSASRCDSKALIPLKVTASDAAGGDAVSSTGALGAAVSVEFTVPAGGKVLVKVEQALDADTVQMYELAVE